MGLDSLAKLTGAFGLSLATFFKTFDTVVRLPRRREAETLQLNGVPKDWGGGFLPVWLKPFDQRSTMYGGGWRAERASHAIHLELDLIARNAGALHAGPADRFQLRQDIVEVYCHSITDGPTERGWHSRR